MRRVLTRQRARRSPLWRATQASAVVVSVVFAGHASGVAATPGRSLGVFIDQSARVPYVAEVDTVATDVELVDVDADGDLDLFLTRGDLAGGLRTNQLFLNDSTGNFRLSPTAAGARPGDYNDAEFGDVNGDGRLDVVLSTTLTTVGLLFHHPVHGRFTDKTDRLPSGQPVNVTIEARLFDAEGDGDLDIVTAVENPFGPGAQDRLFLNVGKGRFEDATSNLPVMSVQSSSSAIGDFDGDRDSDIIVVNNGPFVYLENRGDAHFEATAGRLPAQATDRQSGRDAVVADFDGDEDLDVMFAMSRANPGPMLWLNDGTGTFTDASQTNVPLAIRAGQDLEICDLDTDGDADVIEANSGPVLPPGIDHRFAGARDRVLLNDGEGSFTDVSDELFADAAVDASFAVACGDIDADGDNDIVVGNGKEERVRAYVQSSPNVDG